MFILTILVSTGHHYIVLLVATIYQWCDSSSNMELVFSLLLFPIKRPQLKNAKKTKKVSTAALSFYTVSGFFAVSCGLQIFQDLVNQFSRKFEAQFSILNFYGIFCYFFKLSILDATISYTNFV